MLGLGLLLFGMLYTHAFDPDSTVSHLTPDAGVLASGTHFPAFVEGGSVASAASESSAGRQSESPHDGDGQQHAGEDCALGHPPQGPDLVVPCLSPLNSEGDEGRMPWSLPVSHSAARDLVAPMTHAADSAVLRI
ncbi:hypothetical protein AVL59_16860 [Streptomyces griseochromogenes]|uniref:Secreted protein n=1 Tax=Streptomyces griseochromogenes TaxID=68214 RepID=A0A1B1AX19_9ACTN|nr:hypothetical protein AVL59_16860 [Streptomyces griseochromogenes]